MQNLLRIFFLFFFVLGSVWLQPVYSQTHTAKLFLADSLFEKGLYLEALTHYKEILHNGHEYSPQMLLKMAYTEEALKRTTQTMYYLGLYYNLHPNRAVLKKMEEAAQANGLKGYTYRDADFFITQFKKYYLKLLELLLIFGVIAFTMLAIRPKYKFFKTTTFRASFLLYLAFIFFYINFVSFNQKGIVYTPQIALMSGPSAGSKWLATLTAGNRLTITGEEDIWFKVKWDDKTGYIRKNNLLLLPE